MLIRVITIILISLSVYSEEISLDSMTLEDLMQIKVSSVSKSEEPYFKAPSAIYVITREAIKNAGARTIVDALRLAPGIQISQSTSSAWKVSSRGSHSRFSNKLLVLIDGRSIYTPTFSGVYWDANQVFLEDIERIEVIRGPGSAVWGSNAVNGVINIITRNAEKTEGGLLRLGLGDRSWETSIRYGYALDEDRTAFMRVYFKHNDFDSLDRGSSHPASSGDASDRWDHTQMGFRLDWNASDSDSITLNGNIYRENVNEYIAAFSSINPSDATGENFSIHYKKDGRNDDEFNFRFYYDHYIRDIPQQLRHEVSTFDLDTDYQFNLGDNHTVTAGAGYRLINSELSNSENYRDNYHLFSAFVQDKISLIKNKLELTIGTKYEHIELNGSSLQPSMRMSYSISEDKTLWISYTHAKRTPSFLDDSIRSVPISGGFLINGSNDTHSESINAYEMGYRQKFSDNFTADLALFYHSYSDLIGFSGNPHSFANNIGNGESYGAELSAIFEVTQDWRLTGSYTLTRVDIDFGNYPGTAFNNNRPYVNSDQETGSKHLINLYSHYNITKDLDFDVHAYYTDHFLDTGQTTTTIHSYVKLDARLAWRVNDQLELSLNGYNLLSPSTRESTGFAESPRSFLFLATYLF